MRVGVVGAGITGLVVAGELAKRGHQVDVFEQGAIGGLAAGFPYANDAEFYLDKFYHHIFRSDEHVLRLIDETGLADQLRWLPSKSGIVAQGRLWNFKGPLDLLRFKPMGSLWQRLLMGFNLWRLQKTKDWKPLDTITCREFFAASGNVEAYERFWEPLLKQKFADAAAQAPAAFLWGRVAPRSQSRQGGRESLGYLQGGFQRLLNRMRQGIERSGGLFRTGSPLTRIIPSQKPTAVWKNGSFTFDKIVWTASPEQLVQTIDEATGDVKARTAELPFIAVTQLILVMRRRQSDFYWLNSIDPTISFGGLIEHTNLASTEQYGGEHILYVVNYHRPNDERFEGKTPKQILQFHADSLKRTLPGFSQSDIVRMYCFRDSYASPLYSLGFLDKMPPYRGWFENVDLCGMAQVYPMDRNMNHCVANAVKYLQQTFEPSS
jgi:protoporphyrinogen oxidase